VESQMSPRRAQAAVKQAEALKLRQAGASYEQIARQVGYQSAGGAWRALRKALERLHNRESAEEVRQLELSRLDRLILAVWKNAIDGNGDAIDRVLRIMKRRAELLGLDAPKQVKMDHSGEITLEWEALVRAIPPAELRDTITDKLLQVSNAEMLEHHTESTDGAGSAPAAD